MRRKTWNMVTDDSNDDVIAWNANGKTFTVYKPDVLEEEYLPKAFKHSNFASFLRQLNNYGFRKCHSDAYEFGVQGFERGKPELLTTLKRHDSSKGRKGAPRKKTAGGGGGDGGGRGGANRLAITGGNESLELGAYGGIENEVEQLKRDRLLLLKEVMRLRDTQSEQRDRVEELSNRLEATENFQTQMRHFVQAVHDGENINAALQESGLAGFNADVAALGPRKRQAPRYLPALEADRRPDGVGGGAAPSGLASDSPSIMPPSPLSLEEIDDEHFLAMSTPGASSGATTAAHTLPWPEFLRSPSTDESLRRMVEDMSYEGELDAAKLEAGDEAFVNTLLDRSNSELGRQLSLSFLDSDEMNDMVKELHGAQLGPPEATIAADAKKKSASSSRQGSPSKKK